MKRRSNKLFGALAMLKLFKLEASDSNGRVIQSIAYRYGKREPHLAPDRLKTLFRHDRTTFAGMRARGLNVRASREPIHAVCAR